MQREPDPLKIHLAEAEGAIMLLNALMLVLVEHGVVPVDKMIEAIDIVIETKRNAIGAGQHPEISEIAIGILAALATSISVATPPGGAV
jgi:hypothetical protein